MLEFKDVSFQYESDDYFLFKDLSFTVEKGAFVSIIGSSGCGKSTIFRLMNGLEEQTAGQIEFNKRPIAEVEKTEMAFMPQKDLLLPWRSVLQNVLLPLELQKVDSKKRKQMALDVLATVGLDDVIHKRPSELSGGMRQRVSFARTLVAGKSLLMLDEPFSALDYLTRKELQNWLISRWLKQRRTILFVTHDVEEAIYLSQVIYVMVRQKDKQKTMMHKVEVKLDYPRTEEIFLLPEIIRLKKELLQYLGAVFVEPIGDDKKDDEKNENKYTV